MANLAVTGAAGRMGRRIVALARETENLNVMGAYEYDGHELIGQDAGETAGVGNINVKITETITTAPDVIIDFSLPESTEKWVDICLEHKTALVIGTTGLNENQVRRIKEAGNTIPILWGANMSMGVNLLFKLVHQVAAALPDDYDIEVVEAHHRFKRDAPSGTALELGRQMAEAKQWPFPDCLTRGREGGQTQRQKETIGMHAVRGGDIVGEHSILFSTLGETIELSHKAHTRDTFVRGALRAAGWLVSQKPGYYTMFDVLGL